MGFEMKITYISQLESGCGTVARAVASNTKEPGFKSGQ